jgi:hypothetical protein
MSSPLADIILELSPLDRAMDRFREGGPSCARAIERLYERLREAEQNAFGTDDLREDLETAEYTIERQEELALEEYSE